MSSVVTTTVPVGPSILLQLALILAEFVQVLTHVQVNSSRAENALTQERCAVYRHNLG